MTTHVPVRAAAIAAALTLIPAGLAAADGGHDGMDAPATHPAPAGMTVTATVKADTMKGHNLFLRLRGFRFAPQRAGAAHRRGEGHAHLYVDGVKKTRLYGPAYYLGELPAGRHTIRVTLNGNDHGEYVRGGRPVADSVTVTVAAR